MAKITEALKKLFNLTENADPNKAFERSAINLLPAMIGLQVILIAGVSVSAVHIVTALTQFPELHDSVTAEQLHESVFGFIDWGTFCVICAIFISIIKKFKNSGTPFTGEIPKKLRRIAVIMFAAFIISFAASKLLPAATGYIHQGSIGGYFSNGMNMFMCTLLLILADIFEIGVKLQQESDETI